MEFLAQRLQDEREKIALAETRHNLANRELDISRISLKEALAMSEIEQSNLHSTRSRLIELKEEIAELEKQKLICQESNLKEEDRLRSTKHMATDQLRLLQIDLNKLASDFKVKQRQVEDLEKHRRTIDEEIEIRKRDSDLQLSATSRELDDESRKLNNVKSEIRVNKLEVEQLLGKRRQVEAELTRLQDTFTSENARCLAEEQDLKRRLLQTHKEVLTADKNLRDLKGKISSLQGEQVWSPIALHILCFALSVHNFLKFDIVDAQCVA